LDKNSQCIHLLLYLLRIDCAWIAVKLNMCFVRNSISNINKFHNLFHKSPFLRFLFCVCAKIFQANV